MLISKVSQNKEQHFGNKFKLNEKTIKLIERKTRLSYDEMKNLPIDEATKIMRARAPFCEKFKYECTKIKHWFGRIYKNIGENLGLLEKQHNIYTDIH